MLTFEDLLAAKVAIQMERLSAEGARTALKAALAGNRTLAQELERAGTVDPTVARTIAGHARRCSFLKAESVYVSFLRQRKTVDEPTIEKARIRQRQEGLRLRLGDILVQEGKISREVDQGIVAEARQAFVADNASVTERYVAKGFEGIERPSSTVSEVLGQAYGPVGETTPASPYDSRAPGGPPLAAVQRSVVPPANNRPIPLAASSDGAFDLRNLGHSQEMTAPRMGAATAQSLGLPVATAPPPAVAAPAPTGPSPLAGTGLEARYEVKKKLGEGGMGAVYLAREAATGRDVALKLVLDREKSQEAASRFKREILATSMCGHENIIEIYDAGDTADGSYFMAMEYVPGEELADIIKREGAVAVPRAMDFFIQILTGISAVHSANIVHRDLKPQNFRIWKDPQTGQERVKIMDFGIARIRDAEQQFPDQFYKTMGGKITGSPAYLAPESITEADVDGRADLYSLGIALFRMTTGKLPFSAKEPMEYLPKHLYEKPPVPSQLVPERRIPPELDAIILKLLEKAPDKRFQTAEAVIAEIETKVRPVLGPAGATRGGPADPFSSSEVTSKMPGPSPNHGALPDATPLHPQLPQTPRFAADADLNQATMPADSKLMAELAAEDSKPVAAPVPAPAPPAAVAPAGNKGCLGFLFGGKKK